MSPGDSTQKIFPCYGSFTVMVFQRKPPQLILTFHGDTRDLLHTTPDENDNSIVYPLCRRASIKDIIEGLGVPHTEVGNILQDGEPKTFDIIPEGEERYHIHPLSPAHPPTMATVLRPNPLSSCLFMVDININRLANLLRMAGFDASSVPSGSKECIVRTAVQEHRILLTRNRELLKHRSVIFGRLIRNQDPFRQLEETIHLYSLARDIRPFIRCMRCNGLLSCVPKKEILDSLLPLTQKYYSHFMQCLDCKQIYWRGSHHQHMVRKLKELVQ